MGGKVRRLSKAEKLEKEDAAAVLLRDVAEMPLNDVLQTLSQKLSTTIPELVHGSSRLTGRVLGIPSIPLAAPFWLPVPATDPGDLLS